MSKRFGRNQRRRAREEIDRLTKQGITLSLSLASTARSAVELRRQSGLLRSRVVLLETQIKAAQKVLGPSIALPPPEVILDLREYREVCEAGLMRQPEIGFNDFRNWRPPSGHELSSANALESYKAYTMDVIEGGLEMTDSGPLRTPHAYIRHKGTRALAYAVPTGVLMEMIERPEAINRVAHMLATEFIDTLQRYVPRNRF